MSSSYDDIIGLPHHTSDSRPRMSAINRAAQFSPFAALTGHSAAIAETARLTEKRIQLADDTEVLLTTKLGILVDRLTDDAVVSITYFLPDDIKEGGSYSTVTGTVKKIDDYERILLLKDGTEIPIDDILELESELFNHLL